LPTGNLENGDYWRANWILVNLRTGAFGNVGETSPTGSDNAELWAMVMGLDLESAKTQLNRWRRTYANVAPVSSQKTEQIAGRGTPESQSVGLDHSFPGASESDERPMTLDYVDEVERSTTSLVWHHPNLLPLLQQELDLGSHITNPVYRKIIEAVALVYGDEGVANWTFVLTAICEMGVFEQCGAREGLNDVFSDCGRYPEGYSNPEPFLQEYIRLLKEYALARKTDPYKTVRHYTRGHGFLQRNKLATKAEHPTCVGEVRCPRCGGTSKVAGWEADDDRLNLKLEPAKRNHH
jgi:hypothetical protein